MKKVILSLALVATGSYAFATEVTAEQAIARAKLSNQQTGLKTARAERFRVIKTGEVNSNKTYYVCTSANQTLILPANDVVIYPVIGKLDHPITSASDIGPEFSYWLGEYDRQIDFLIKAEEEGNLIKSAKTTLRSSNNDYKDIAPLLTTEWGQDAPYYYLTPGEGTQRGVTGCVATAAAQVMNWHKWPKEACTGVGHATLEGGPELSMDFTGLVFDWDNMKDTYDKSVPFKTPEEMSKEETAVATLMRACGFASNMKYTYTSSGTPTADLVHGMVEFFHYNKSMNIIPRDMYTTDEWIKMLYDELTNNGPILYGGFSSKGGHQFVLDGFDSKTKMLHFNWGWYGRANGFFYMDLLDPYSDDRNTTSEFGYNRFQDAVFNVRPDDGSSVKADPVIGYTQTPKCTVYSDELVFEWQISGDGLRNYSAFEGEFTLGAIIKDMSGKEVEKLTGPTQYFKLGSYPTMLYNLKLPLPINLSDGLYVIYLTGALKDKPAEIVMSPSFEPNYVMIEVKDGQITTTNTSKYLTATMELPKAVKADEKLEIKATVTNTSNLKLNAWIQPKVYTGEQIIGYRPIDGSIAVTLEPFGTREITFLTKIDVQYAGDYLIALGNIINNEEWYSLASQTVTVIEKNIFDILNWKVDTENLIRDSRANVTLTVTKKNDWWRMFETKAVLVEKANSLKEYVIGSSSSVSIPMGQETPVTFEVNVPEIPAGTYTLKFMNKDMNMSYGEFDATVTSAGAVSVVTKDNASNDGALVNLRNGRVVSSENANNDWYFDATNNSGKKVFK